jgi:hypothetical protein
MSTNDTARPRPSRYGWATIAVGVSIGLAYLIAGWLGDNLAFGLFGLALMLLSTVAFLVLSRFSETAAGLLDRHDERINRIDGQATAIAGLSVITAVIVGFVIDVAKGGDGSPYAALGAIGGLSYLAAIVYFRLRG